MSKKTVWILVYLNIWRIIPAYFCVMYNKMREKCIKDFEVWDYKVFRGNCNKAKLLRFGFILLDRKEYRNVCLMRLSRDSVKWLIFRLLMPPMESLYIFMPTENIGGGLYFQHGFATIVTAERIGENCHINQQVTIGYNGLEAPCIGDNCVICAGAIVIGGVNVGNNATIGAGAVVTKDVPENAIMVGEKARVLRIKE